MDTLRRVGSIRKSLRKPKKPSLAPEPQIDVVDSTEETQELSPSYFTLTCTDAVVTSSSGSFQPTHLRVTIARHRKTYTSEPVLWEPSLKCHLTGTGVWHPPFVQRVSVSPPLRSKSKGTLKHKDAFVSLENVDLKGKKKLLAKIRVNLSDYYVAASVSPVAFKLKLFPESSKISAAFIHFSIHRTDQIPESLTPPLLGDDNSSNLSVPAALTRTSSDSQVDDEVEKSPVFSKHNSPVVLRPSSLHLKSSITVEKPKRVDNNNDVKRPPVVPQRPESKLIQNIPFVRPQSHSDASRFLAKPEPDYDLESDEEIRDSDKEERSINSYEKLEDPDPSRLLAEPEDTEILTPKKIISGVVLPTGPPPPLPQRTLPPVVPSVSEVQQTQPQVAKEEPVAEPQGLSSVVVKVDSPPVEIRKKLPTPVISESPFKVPSTPVKSSKKQLDVDSDSDDDRAPPHSISLSIGHPSPKLTPFKQSSVEKDILDWAKVSLTPYPQIKVTNLSSSWRNGIGFCALLHAKHPNLVPMNSLKMQNMEENCELAVQVAELLGMDTSITAEDLSNKSAVVVFLRELRRLLTENHSDPPPSERVTEFQSRWYENCSYFSKEVAHLFVQEEEKIEAASQEAEQAHDSPDQQTSEQSSPNRDRVKELIAAAHREALENNGSGMEDVMTRNKLRESKTISEEMVKLAMEEDRISKEKDALEKILRDESISAKVLDTNMQRWMQLVNEKNSLVRRQMQLNIAEQEKAITQELEEIQWKLQKYTDMEDSQKTEAMRRNEQVLLEQLLEAVNKKNELVLHLHNQEMAIDEDQTIQKLVENKDFSSFKKDEECVIQ